MIRLLVAMISSTWLVFPALGAGLDAATINGAEYRAKLPADDKVDAVVVKLQVLLDRVRFSPGEIDGKLETYNLRAKKVDPSKLGVDTVKQFSGYLDDEENDKHLFYCKSSQSSIEPSVLTVS